MLRNVLSVALVILAIGCDVLGAPTRSGALRVHGVSGQGDLYLDGIGQGPVQSEQVFQGLAEGVHLVELRERGATLASMPIEVRAGMILDARIEVAEPPALATAPPVPERRATNRTRPTPSDPPASELVATATAPADSPTPSGAVAPEVAEPTSAPRAAPAAGAGEQASPRAGAAERSRPRDRALADRAALPEAPSSTAIDRAMVGLRACGVVGQGRAQLTIEVSGVTGRAEQVTVGGSFSSPGVEACVERVLRQAVFPRSRRATYTVRVVRTI